MVSTTFLIIALVAIGIVILINLAFTLLSVKYVYAMLKRMEDMMKDVTSQQYQTLNSVCDSYKGVCETYHKAQDLLDKTIEKITKRNVVNPSMDPARLYPDK